MAQLINGDEITFSPYHHSASPSDDKSIWTIKNAYEEEKKLANEIIRKGYHIYKNRKTVGYNVKRDNNKLVVLGRDTHTKDLKLSRFEGLNRQWHGYPINHVKNSSDKPEDEILNKLYINGNISEPERKRIKRGKPI